MNSQAYNLLWIRPDFAKEGEIFTPPLEEVYLNDLQKICKINSGVDVRFWVDFKRLSNEQQTWLQKKITEIGIANLQLLDLRSIDLYKNDYVFNTEGTDNRGIANLEGVAHIYGAVDAAKILVCMEGNYKQQFFSDLDIKGLDVNSEILQNKLGRVGLLIGGKNVRYENQILAFDSSHQELALNLFEKTRELADNGETGWDAIVRLVDKMKREGLDLDDFTVREEDFDQEVGEGKITSENGLGINKE